VYKRRLKDVAERGRSTSKDRRILAQYPDKTNDNLKNNDNNEKTEVFRGVESATNAILDFVSRAGQAIDACIDSIAPSVMMGVDAIKNERIKAKKRGVNLRYITEVTKDNISYCKELSEFAEVRHLDGIKGNFEVSKGNMLRDAKGGEYVATASLQEAEPIAHLIYSNVRDIVEQQQFVFDTLWTKAIPFRVRLKEIEEGIKPENIEIIVDPKQALEAELRLLNSAKEEVQMIFSTPNTFLLQERQIGIIQMLSKLANRGVKVRILTPVDNDVKELISNLKNQQKPPKKTNSNRTNHANNSNNNHNNNRNTNANSIIDIQNIEPSSSINAKIIIVDKQNSLAMEINDGTKDSLDDTIGLSTLSNSKSTVASYSAIFENLSKQNHLYKQLKESYQKVENTNLMQREFINIAAHELSTPIQPILGYAELLLEEEIDDRKKHALLGIVHNSERLQKLASDILDIARIESNTFLVNKKVLNLNSFISNAVKDYIKRLGQYEARDIAALISNVNGGGGRGANDDKNKDLKRTGPRLFLRSGPEEEILVQADEERLMQVMHNILDNAFKFTDTHGSVTVTLEKQDTHSQIQTEEPTQLKQQQQQQQQQQHHAIISITDRGTGIDPDILPKLFSKFATKSYKGTGLGLYISKNIVDAHGGKLLAYNNTDGNGATFTIMIPIFNKGQDD
jgi:two-component system, OmpR family, sensor histidine kinase VicK